MRRLAEKLNVKAASLYTHIESMEVLFTEIGLAALQKQKDCLLNAIGEKHGAAAIEAAAQSYRQFAAEHIELYQLIMKMPSGDNEILKEAAAMTAEPFMNKCLVLRRTQSARENCRVVMLNKLAVCFVQPYLVMSVLVHACLEIVALNYFGHSAEITKGIHMCSRPAFLIHREESLNVGISAVRKRCHKNIHGNYFARIRIYDSSRIACPVHLHNLAGLMVQVHCCTVFQCVVTVVFLELRQLIWRFPVIAALLAIFEPQQIQRNAAFLHFS